ncbi:GNAT family N-acetyltransferase [Sphingomonas tabacisoli]|uniref:GNAT family N-acetyltransferase n=1 Tax=Sphingomonas tabacisoli TaxID=2249466 RepID=A0ABW4I1S2_9SPHN
MPEAGADPALVAAWLSARSTARGLPQPVPDHGGLRVDTKAPTEKRRYVFARPCDGLAVLGGTIDEAHVPLKLCASANVLAGLVGPRWVVDDSAAMMMCEAAMPVRDTPGGYGLTIDEDGGVFRCNIRAVSGEHAASGYAVENAGAFVFDRIVTEPAHQRRGLGSAMMAALAARRRSSESRFVLVATVAGRALYESLGWLVVAPYATATLRP